MAAPTQTEHQWRVLVISIIASVAIVLIATIAITFQVKSVTIVDRGVVRSVTTVAGNVGEVLHNNDVKLGAHDQVTPHQEVVITDGERISITRSAPVKVVSGNQTWIEWLPGNTLKRQLESLPKATLGQRGATASAGGDVFIIAKHGQYNPVAEQATVIKVIHGGQTSEIIVGAYDDLTKAIKRAGINLSPIDILTVGRDESGKIIARIQQITVETVTRKETIDFKKQRVEDVKIAKGQSAITTKGVPGERTITERVEKIDGKVAKTTLISVAVTKKPVDEVTTVGTGDPRKVSKQLAPAAPANPTGAQAIARDMLTARGWGQDQFGCLVSLWNRESGWNVNSQNRSSGAYGIPQALPGTKMASAGADWRTNPATQIRWGLGYIAGRYGTPCGAWAHFRAHNWY